MAPEISAVILSYNRAAELERTLSILRAQQGAAFEVIVVDNASTDGTQAMVSGRFPEVRLLSLGQNVGVRGRRIGAEAAAAAIVMLYDDDSSPSTPSDLASIAGFFKRRPEASGLCTEIHRETAGFSETWGWEDFSASGDAADGYEGLFVHTSGTAFRRADLLSTRAFDNDWFWGDVEFDAALEMAAAGYRLFYWPKVRTSHRASQVHRDKRRYYRASTCNHLLTLRKYFRGGEWFGYAVKEVLYQSLLARQAMPAVWTGVADYLAKRSGAPRAAGEVSARVREYSKEIRQRRYPGPLTWLSRQRALRAYRKARMFA